jgi:hypothetical protein
MRTAFKELKNRSTSPPVLMLPRLDQPYILATDASTQAIGWTLYQRDESRRIRVLSYGGRALRGLKNVTLLLTWKRWRFYVHSKRTIVC